MIWIKSFLFNFAPYKIFNTSQCENKLQIYKIFNA